MRAFLVSLFCLLTTIVTTAQSSLKICGKDISEDGKGSAYYSHSFYIESEDFAIESPNWILELPLANGEIQSIELEDDDLSCATAPIEDLDNYQITSTGEIKGQLKFNCRINGIEYESTLDIVFELKLVIEYAVIERIEEHFADSYYHAYYRVKYLGADRIMVGVEEEYSSKVIVNFLYEPYIAYGVAEYITAPYRAWIDFEATNSYGKATYTIEFEPYGVIADVPLVNDNTDGVVDVYNVAGVYIGRFANLSDFNNMGQRGIFIIKRSCNGKVETFKYVNK